MSFRKIHLYDEDIKNEKHVRFADNVEEIRYLKSEEPEIEAEIGKTKIERLKIEESKIVLNQVPKISNTPKLSPDYIAIDDNFFKFIENIVERYLKLTKVKKKIRKKKAKNKSSKKKSRKIQKHSKKSAIKAKKPKTKDISPKETPKFSWIYR